MRGEMSPSFVSTHWLSMWGEYKAEKTHKVYICKVGLMQITLTTFKVISKQNLLHARLKNIDIETIYVSHFSSSFLCVLG